ncbi:hypothetical protein PoB_005163500 [Plakobranchus ocellatus]|uniref:Reverse transcriptase n=1 Tax=Plakobranchus ocellatus TaxID=259542 RepID=A0AAV4C0K2_9GAST|nr:hypothetical protein PoB_005163500 [Plakobranchus ocellatus]
MHRLKKALERRPTASNRTFETEFTVFELDIALRKGRLGKAPGLDGVTQEMISQLSPKAKNVLLNLYNRTWKSGELPRAWRTAVLIVIEKQQQGAALPSVVILTDCRALVQALGGSRSENVGEAVQLADHLLKTEGVQTTV